MPPRRVERGDEAELRLVESPPDLVDPRLDAAGRLGPGDLPAPARARADPHPARHHADRARRGDRARARPLRRRRRLRRQAVLGAGTDGAGARACCAAAGRSGSPNGWSPATSISTAKPAGCVAARATCIWGRPNSVCSNICWSARAGCSRARNCSTASGGNRWRSTSARSTSISAGCARRCRAAASAIPIRTVRGAGLLVRRDLRQELTPGDITARPAAR